MPDPIAPTGPAAASGPAATGSAPTGSAADVIGQQLLAQFPQGVLPQPVPQRNFEVQRELEAAAAAERARLAREGILPGVTGPTGATGAPAASGPTGAVAPAPALSGPLGAIIGTGATGPAESGATGATGATGPAESGATGPKDKLTDAEKDAMEHGLPVAAGTAFKLIRKESDTERAGREAAEARVAELETRLTDAEAAKADPAQIEALKETIKRYEEEFSVSRVEATQEYIEKIQKPLAATEAQLLALAAKHNIKDSDLRAALAETDPSKRSDRLSELSNEFNRLDTAAFDRLALDYTRLEDQRAQAKAQAASKFQAMQADQEAQARRAQAEFQKNWKGALTTTQQKLVKEMPMFGKTGDATWDAEMEKINAEVQATDIVATPNEVIADALYKRGAFKLLLGLVTELHTDKSALSAEVAKLRGTSVPAGGGNLPGPTGSTPPPNASFNDIARAKLDGVLPR